MSQPDESLARHERWWSDHIRAAKDVNNTVLADWLFDSDKLSREYVARFVREHLLRSVLEFGPGTFIDYQTHWMWQPIEYRAVEMTPELVDYGIACGANVVRGSVVSVDHYGQADLAYCRHVLEHLPGYHNALETLIAHARRYAIVVFFQLDTDAADDRIVIDETVAVGTYCNTYSRARIEAWLSARGLSYWWARPGTDYVLVIDVAGRAGG